MRATSRAVTPDAMSWPTVVETYWKLENRPRLPGLADSTRKVVAAANSPPTDSPWSSRATTSTTGPARPAAA
jgi:hypothetical protein